MGTVGTSRPMTSGDSPCFRTYQRRQKQADIATRARFHALIDQVLGVDLAQPFQRKGRAGTVAQQSFQAVAVGPLVAPSASTEKPPPCSHAAMVSGARWT